MKLEIQFNVCADLPFYINIWLTHRMLIWRDSFQNIFIFLDLYGFLTSYVFVLHRGLVAIDNVNFSLKKLLV